MSSKFPVPPLAILIILNNYGIFELDLQNSAINGCDCWVTTYHYANSFADLGPKVDVNYLLENQFISDLVVL
ncbi:hypothetical protein CsatA_020470 [Cannabis sativa]